MYMVAAMQKKLFYFETQAHLFWNLVSDDKELTKLFETVFHLLASLIKIIGKNLSPLKKELPYRM
jgi:hypothetical protein